MFRLRLVTPSKKLVEGLECLEVFVPAFRGELNILPGHAPLVTTLETGVLKYRLAEQPNELYAVAVSWGYCEVNPQGVNILAETAESSAEIDVARVQEALKSAEAQLNNEVLTEEDSLKVQRKLKRAEVRLEVVQGHNQGTPH